MSNLGVGHSVDKAIAPHVSIIRFIHNIYTVVKIFYFNIKELIIVSVEAEIFTVS